MKRGALGVIIAGGLASGCIITLPPASTATDGGDVTHDDTHPVTTGTTGTTDTASTTGTTGGETTTSSTAGTTATTTGTTDATTGTTGGALCDDGVQNGDETDLDCGGSCSPCATGSACVVDADCASASCEAGVCTDAACNDGVQNGDETDLDCGGSCMDCTVGQACLGDDDCVGTCTNNLCDPVECTMDAECAALDGPCSMGACVDGSCAPQAINEAAACDDGDLCTDKTTCTAGVCGGGLNADCSDLDDACNLGACDPQDGLCKAQALADGTPCNDGDNCTVDDACLAGACVDQDGADHLLYDGFADNSKGWTFFNDQWAIGPAQAGCGDPGVDHSPTDDNGVAGVVLGGCLVTPGGNALVSPKIDASGQKELWLSFYHVLNNDNPATESRVEVWDGGKWVILEAFAPVSEADWTLSEYDLAPYANPGLQIRWWHTLLADQPPAVGAWNVDDVVLGPATCAPY